MKILNETYNSNKKYLLEIFIYIYHNYYIRYLIYILIIFWIKFYIKYVWNLYNISKNEY